MGIKDFCTVSPVCHRDVVEEDRVKGLPVCHLTKLVIEISLRHFSVCKL